MKVSVWGFTFDKMSETEARALIAILKERHIDFMVNGEEKDHYEALEFTNNVITTLGGDFEPSAWEEIAVEVAKRVNN